MRVFVHRKDYTVKKLVLSIRNSINQSGRAGTNYQPDLNLFFRQPGYLVLHQIGGFCNSVQLALPTAQSRFNLPTKIAGGGHTPLYVFLLCGTHRELSLVEIPFPVHDRSATVTSDEPVLDLNIYIAGSRFFSNQKRKLLG